MSALERFNLERFNHFKTCPDTEIKNLLSPDGGTCPVCRKKLSPKEEVMTVGCTHYNRFGMCLECGKSIDRINLYKDAIKEFIERISRCTTES